MTDNTQPKRFSLAGFIGFIWSLHVLVAALLYPRVLLPTDEDLKKQILYKTISFLFGTFILLVNIFCLVALFTRSTWVDAAKVFFVFLAWLSVGIVYILFNHLRDVYRLFAFLEEEAIQSRDQSVMLIRAGQAALKAGNRKLLQQTDIEFSFTSLLKKVGPLALLFLNKEKNLLHIALEAGKVFFMGSRLFKNLF